MKNPLDTIKAYHRQTKHRLDKYANGPETIDWDSQPSPFRYFEGTDYHNLTLIPREMHYPYASLWQTPESDGAELSQANIAHMLELSLGLSAWKVYGSAKWSLRCNPSSGNLHPTEAYLLLPQIDDQTAGIYHYCPETHGLERRGECIESRGIQGSDSFYIGLSSVAWREGWKYGERAFRYCQLDIGHAVMALRIAAATLGWHLSLSTNTSTSQLSRLIGLDEKDTFYDDESEHAEILLKVSRSTSNDDQDLQALQTRFIGQANRLDRKHFYDWPIIDEAFQATEDENPGLNLSSTEYSPREVLELEELNAVELIKSRRSATDFNPSATMPLHRFGQILEALLPRNDSSPWDVYPFRSNISLVFYVHRVDDLRPGLYALIRNPEHLSMFKSAMREQFLWEAVDGLPSDIGFYRLLNANAQSAARTLSCHQAIASNSAFCVSMISDYDSNLQNNPAMYRHLHWEAGMIGQLLYLEAETMNYRGTGIGCFFDDAVHETLGIKDESLQVVYHFTVGEPVVDQRITSLSAYTDRD